MSSVTQKQVATEQQVDILPSQLYYPLANISSTSPYEQPPMSSPSPFDWEADIQDSREGAPRNGGHVPNTAPVRTQSLLSEISWMILTFL